MLLGGLSVNLNHLKIRVHLEMKIFVLKDTEGIYSSVVCSFVMWLSRACLELNGTPQWGQRHLLAFPSCVVLTC